MYLNINLMYVRKCLLIFIVLLMVSCKDSFLDMKPSTDIVAPKTLDDFQQILDYTGVNYVSGLPQLGSDEYEFITEKDWTALPLLEKNAYIWAPDIYEGQAQGDDWNNSYQSVFYANSVIDGLKSIPISHQNEATYKDILGQAYFARAFAFFDLAKNFATAYDEQTATKDLGIPLKLSPNIDEIAPRATLDVTYRQIFLDLQQAITNLGENLKSQRNRPNKPAAYALAARICLSMRRYIQAEAYADSCLALYNKIMDYNKLNLTTDKPFSATDEESMVFARYGKNHQIVLYLSPVNMTVNKMLYSLYDDNDIRKAAFFKKVANSELIKIKYGYTGTIRFPYAGLACDEIYLIKAECAARRNDIVGCTYFINTLLVNRYKQGTFKPKEFKNADEALDAVLLERRKELVWRAGLRWDDLRRLNKEGKNIVLERKIGDQTFQLLPNSPLYIFPIPQSEIGLSHIQQNIR